MEIKNKNNKAKSTTFATRTNLDFGKRQSSMI